jgi:hypothetical protein
MLQSQAQRSTVLADTGSENSVSAPGAPIKPSRVSIELVTCICTFCLPPWVASPVNSSPFMGRWREAPEGPKQNSWSAPSPGCARDFPINGEE